MKRTYPLLKRLVLTQLGVVLLCFLVLLSVYNIISTAQIKSSLSTIKEQVAPLLAAKQEQWRAWKYLELYEAIEEDKNSIISNHPVESIDVLKQSEYKIKENDWTIIFPKENRRSDDYIVVARISTEQLIGAKNAQRTVIIVLALMGILLFVCVLYSGKYIYETIYKPIMSLGDILSRKTGHSTGHINAISAIGEMKDFIQQIDNLVVEAQEYEKKTASFELATQVAHDIRSPLEVFKSLRQDLNTLPAESRSLVLQSTRRIEEIAQNLLKTYKQTLQTEKANNATEVLSVIDQMIIEKEYSKPRVIFKKNYSNELFGTYINFDRASLRRILSNLINNSIEAIPEGRKGIVSISLLKSESLIHIILEDNGIGICSSKQANLFKKGFTTKEEGHGLGLFGAKKELELKGGQISFESVNDQGSIFKISLPISEPPSLYAHCIDYTNYKKILVLDDDKCFHDLWRKKLDGISIPVEYFSDIDDLLLSYSSIDSEIMLLSDLELSHPQHDGLDLIKMMKCEMNSILVTAKAEDERTILRCEVDGVHLIDKASINYLRLKEPRVDPVKSIVLIDDDKLIRASWIHFFKNKESFKFESFKNTQEFFDCAGDFNSDTTICIDSNLDNGVKGEIEAEKIFNLGFENIYLSTGYEKGSITAPFWIKKILSKDPSKVFA